MSKKPTAALSASLVAVKGAATPSPDMPARAPVSATPAAPAPAKPEANLAPLNFRVAASFRREFKTYAATHDLKLNELLRLSFEAYRRTEGEP
jgi:hypothetical protein